MILDKESRIQYKSIISDVPTIIQHEGNSKKHTEY